MLVSEKRIFDPAWQFVEAGVDVNYQYPLSRKFHG